MTARALARVELRHDEAVVVARQRARDVAESLGFDRQDQTRIATAVSELARNAYRYARRRAGVARSRDADALEIEVERRRARDRRTSTTSSPAATARRPAWGRGCVGVRRLMDELRDRRAGRGAARASSVDKRSRPAHAAARRARGRATSWRRRGAASPLRGGHAPERGAAAGARRGPRPPGGAARAQPRARGAPTAASSRSTPSSTTAPSACATPTSASRASWPT